MSSRNLEPLLAPPIDEERIQNTWSRIQIARASRTSSRTRTFAFAGFAVAAAVILAIVVWPHGTPGDGNRPALELGAGVRLDKTIMLADASAVIPDPGASVEVLESEAAHFAVTVHGRVEFDLRGGRHWQIETPRATLDVTATHFVVDASAERVAITVVHGDVMVRGERVPGRALHLSSGQQLVLADEQLTRATRPSAPSSPSQAALQPPPPSGPDPTTRPSPKPAIRPPAPEPLGSPIEEADRLRAAGDIAGARTILEREMTTAHDPEVRGLAAFTFGRMAQTDGDLDKAQAAFARVIELGTPQGLLEDAYAHRIQALVGLKRIRDASDLLAAYDQRFPKGARRTSLHTLVGR
ncbi:MAG: FecR domain-containing protein [Kofleriaceae bacterium]